MTNLDVVWYQLTCTYDYEKVTMTTNLDIMWLTRDPGYQEMHMIMYLDFLSLSFKILHKMEQIIHYIMYN